MKNAPIVCYAEGGCVTLFFQYTGGLSLVESVSHRWKTDEFNNSLGDINR